MAEKVTFDGPNKLIIVNDGEITLDTDSDIYGAWKRWLIEQDGPTSKYLQAVRTIGGDPTVTGQFVSAYFFLMNGWRIRPYEGDHQLIINGNLYLDAGVSGGAFIPTVGDYNVLITQNVANISTASIQELEIANLQQLIEVGRPHHSGTGDIWYWDPYGGDDSNAGTAQETAFKTFAATHDAAANRNHDIIICVPGDPTGLTVSTEVIEITKDYLFIRGPGRDFALSPTTEVLIRSAGVELSSIIINEGVKVYNDFALLKEIWIHNSTSHSIEVSGSGHTRIENIHIMDSGEDGIYVGSNVHNLKIGDKSVIHQCKNGVNIQGTDASGILINSDICDNSEYGINIGSGVICTIIDAGTTFSRNAAGNINDNGISTAYGGDFTGERTKDKVWSANVSAYTGKGSAGQVQENLLYGGRVSIDSVNGESGIEFPIGTHRYPSNNLTEALVIARTHGIDMLELHTDLTVETTHDISNLAIETIGIMGTTLTLTDGCSAANSAFRYLNIDGTLTNGDIILVESCTVLSLANFTGVMNVVALGQNAEITIGAWAELIQVTAGGSAGNEPEITINSANLNMSHYTGNIKLKGKTGTGRTVLNSSSSNIILDSTCVSGTIQLLGTGFLETDNSGPNCTIDIDGFISNPNIADYVWDETLDDHGSAGSTGRKLKDIGSSVILTGTATGNGNGLNQIELDAFASAVDGAYDPALITIVAGTGSGQSRGIYQYEGSTGICTVDRNWKTQPTSASEYVISAWPGREHVNEGLAQGGTANTITLNYLASSTDNVYNHQIVFIRSGVGEDQVGLILTYDGTTKIATIDKDWDIIPDTTTGYTLLPTHIDYADTAKAIWSEPLTAGAPFSAEEILQKIKKLAALIPAGV